MIAPPPEQGSIPTRVAGSLAISTVAEPLAMGCGGGATAVTQRSVSRAASSLTTRTGGAQGGMIGVGAPTVSGQMWVSVSLA